jgi:hypothetical protein
MLRGHTWWYIQVSNNLCLCVFLCVSCVWFKNHNCLCIWQDAGSGWFRWHSLHRRHVNSAFNSLKPFFSLYTSAKFWLLNLYRLAAAFRACSLSSHFNNMIIDIHVFEMIEIMSDFAAENFKAEWNIFAVILFCFIPVNVCQPCFSSNHSQKLIEQFVSVLLPPTWIPKSFVVRPSLDKSHEKRHWMVFVTNRYTFLYYIFHLQNFSWHGMGHGIVQDSI